MLNALLLTSEKKLLNENKVQLVYVRFIAFHDTSKVFSIACKLPFVVSRSKSIY